MLHKQKCTNLKGTHAQDFVVDFLQFLESFNFLFL
jgi:hypothetical protein